nr:hypothetical protein CFP56_20002 [Quercus suber]
MAAPVADMAGTQLQWEFNCDLEVDYESEENASMVYAALAVDKELQPDKVKRQMEVSNGKLIVHFEANLDKEWNCDTIYSALSCGMSKVT